jgi:hypothetical protein
VNLSVFFLNPFLFKPRTLQFSVKIVRHEITNTGCRPMYEAAELLEQTLIQSVRSLICMYCF